MQFVDRQLHRSTHLPVPFTSKYRSFECPLSLLLDQVYYCKVEKTEFESFEYREHCTYGVRHLLHSQHIHRQHSSHLFLFLYLQIHKNIEIYLFLCVTGWDKAANLNQIMEGNILKLCNEISTLIFKPEQGEQMYYTV